MAASGDTAALLETRNLLRLLVAAVVIAALRVAQDVFIPVILAVILSFVLSPLVNMLGRAGLRRAPAVIVSVLLALGLLGLVGTLIGRQAAGLAADAPRYARTIEQKIEGLQTLFAARVSAISTAFGIGRPPSPAPAPSPSSPSRPTPIQPDATGQPTRPLPVEVVQPEDSTLVVVRSILAPVVGPLETTVIVFIVTIFTLLQREDLRDRFIRLAGSGDLHRTTLAIDDAGQRLSRYFVSQFMVNATFGLVITLGLWMIGVPSPGVWGGLAGVLRFVPYIGALLAATAPIALAAAIDPGWSMVMLVTGLFVIVEPLVAYVVEPLVYGHSTGLSPVAVIVAAVFWTWMWGPIGLILSTPITLCLVVMGRHVKSLEFMDILLGDQPALTPLETFYQRLLSGNREEALETAETALADRTLLDFYDTIALEALRRAADDVARGALGRERAMAVEKSMLAVVDDLGEHDDAGSADGAVIPRARPSPGVVACIAGRGPLDDAVSAMLVQLLEQRGVAAQQVPYAAVGREHIAQFDPTNVVVVAVLSVGLEGAPAHLRYLIRRLRVRVPRTPIVAGIWREGDALLADAALQKTVGADVLVTSLRAAIDAIAAGTNNMANAGSALAATGDVRSPNVSAAHTSA
ncbi:MAG TPA: AI-2E family transporter [Vicinamibacterales bacterium]|jgi:predicted PurR-regulated permease PerM|nr:AI-2E family transporter [Vicinamibacterales bacterium]